MADHFSRSLLKVAIAQVCQGLGWHAMQSTPCDILVDIMQRYIEKTGRISSQYAAQFGRTFVNLDDLALTFQDMGLSLYELENYVHEVEPMPFVHDVPSFPIPKKNNLQHPPPGSRHCRERLASIPEYMPPLVGVKEDFTPSHDRKDSLFNMDTDSPELLSPSSQDGLERRGEKRSPDYVDHSIKRFRLDGEGNLQEVVIGAGEDSSKRRVGKLPEAVTPPRRTSVLISEQKSAVTQALSMAGNAPKSKSPKQQKYGTQETKAPKMRLPVSTASSKGPMKPQSKSPKHHLFSPKGPSKYPVKSKTPVNVGVIPQPNQAVEFKPAKGSKSQRANGGAISTLLSAALQIQDDENKGTVVPLKKKDSAMSIYDFDDDTEGKGKENVAGKEAGCEGMKSPITSGESKADPNSPRVYDEYEIVRTTYPTEEVEDPKKDVKKKEKGKVRKKKEKVKQRDKKKPKVTLDQPLLFLPDVKVKTKEIPVKVKVEVVPEVESKPAQYTSYVPTTKKVKPPKMDVSKFVKKEPADEMEVPPKLVIKTSAKDRNVGKKASKSPITLKKTKKLEKWKKKKFKKDRYKVTLGFAAETGNKSLTSKFGSPSKVGKDRPVKKLNIIKTNSANPFQIKISSPKVEVPEPVEPLVVREKTKKKKKIKEEKKVTKEETSKSSTKDKEQKTAKSEPSSGSSVPKITLKMGGNTGDGKFVIKTIRPPSPASDKDSPPSSPIPAPPPPPVPKISIPVLPKKSAAKPSTPKASKSVIKKPMKVKESSVFVDSLPPPTKPRQKSTAGKGTSKTAKSNNTDTPVSPKASTGRGRKKSETPTSAGKKAGANKSSPKNSSMSPAAVKSSGTGKEKGFTGSKANTSSKSNKTTGKGTGNPPGRPPKSSKTPDPPKIEAKEPPAKKTAEKPPKKEKTVTPAPPPPPAKVEDVPMTIVTETLGTFVSETGEKIWICPACKRPDDGSPMVGCDDCDDWYHWPCVGITSEPNEDEWFCERCLALKIKSKGKKRGRKKKL